MGYNDAARRRLREFSCLSCLVWSGPISSDRYQWNGELLGWEGAPIHVEVFASDPKISGEGTKQDPSSTTASSPSTTEHNTPQAQYHSFIII